MEENDKLGKAIYNLIDAMFWLADETSRWWQIGKLSIQIKELRRHKATLNKQIIYNEKHSISISSAQTAELASLNESISKLASKGDFIKSKCWAMTPEILFATLSLLFFYAVIWINPSPKLIAVPEINTTVFSGSISRVRELPILGHSIVSDSAWFNNKLYVAGNNGVTEIDTATGQSQNLKELPLDFLAKSLVAYDNKLIISGYSGIFVLDGSIIKPLFQNKRLPFKLINSLAITKKNTFLIATLGQGILRSNSDSTAVMVPNTQSYIVKDFGHQNKELWILHEEGILTGSTSRLTNLELQILVGKKPRCMVTTEKNVFIGTDQGIVAGYRSSKNWVWTMLSSGNPGFINEMVNAGDVLFIASDEGVFRYYKGKMDRLSSIPTYSLCICDTFLAAAGKSSVMLYYFDVLASREKNSIFGTVPELGTYTPSLPVSAMPMNQRPRYNRMPDYGLIETDGKQALGESSMLTDKFSPDKKPMIELPIELQKPIFTDVIKFGKKYYLTTLNRGVWSYDGQNWCQIKYDSNRSLDRLCGNSQHCYAYNSNAGIYEIKDDKAYLTLSSKDTKGVHQISISNDNNLILLYSDGNVKSFDGKKLYTLFNIPGDRSDDCHSVLKISNQYVAVLNQGLLIYEGEGNWNLVLYSGNLDSSKISDTQIIDNKSLYIAINDGRIFEYSNGKLQLSGVVPDHPTSISYSDVLWISGKDSIFFKNNNSFIAKAFKSEDSILGIFPDMQKKVIYVFTTAGLKTMSN